MSAERKNAIGSGHTQSGSAPESDDDREGATPQPDSAVRLEGVGKRYVKLAEQAMLLRSIIPFRKPQRSELWALRDVDLTVGRGETVGIIGRNGAGKTTMLRLLAGVTRPTAGRVAVAGRIAPLLSVGVGFHREMSGRENVYVNGILLGLSRREVDARFDEIVAFAELEEFIETPVKFYSSGMYLRLGFSVAVHADPEILLVDEVLAVGDVAFQLKCFDRMREIQRRGATIVLVSHSMEAIRLLCPRAVVLRHGRVEFDGGTEQAISRHHQLLNAEREHGAEVERAPAVQILDRRTVGPRGPATHLYQDEPVSYLVRVRFERPVDSPHLEFRVFTHDGTLAYGMQSRVSHRWRRFEPGDEAEVAVSFRSALGGGSYRLTLDFRTADGRTPLFLDPDGTLIYLAPPLGSTGFADLQADITVDGEVLSDHPDLLLGTSR